MNLMAGGVKWESFGAKSDFAIVYITITANDIKTCCHMGTEQRDKVSGPTPSSKQLKGLKQSSSAVNSFLTLLMWLYSENGKTSQELIPYLLELSRR